VAEENYDFFSFDRTSDPPNGQESLGTFTFSDIQSTATNWNQDFTSNTPLQAPRNENGAVQSPDHVEWPLSIDNLLEAGQTNGRSTTSIANTRIDVNDIDFSPGSDYMNSSRSNFLLNYFGKISQPPASILITGVKKWRRLQRHLTRLSKQHRVGASALFAIIELLAKDDQSVIRVDTIDNMNSMGPAVETTRGSQERS
jgi:hypothetical protein